MKRKVFYPIGILLMIISASFFTSCRDKVYEEITYTANVPVIMGFKELRSAIKTTQPVNLEKTGKIYFKDNYIFVNEYCKGIHVIDNTNPSNPQVKAFIEIPGNIDMAIRNNILYADSYVDLVALDISNPLSPVEVDRYENAFPNVLPELDFAYPVYGLDFNKGVVVGWETKKVTELVENHYQNYGKVFYDHMGTPRIGSSEVMLMPSSTVGVGGSMARFTVNENVLYAVHNNVLKLFNLTGPSGITGGAAINMNRQIETIFPHDNKLFLGTTTGMIVYDITTPTSPLYVSEFNHINSCDPVVIEGRYAYVTLRSGTMCNGFTNQLDIIDISSIQHPFLVKSYPMFNPYGLGIDNGTLFICDGDAGLKVYNASDPLNLLANQIAHFKVFKTYDVIPLGGILLLISGDGLYQYDYSDLNSLKLLSHIPVYAE